MHQINLLTMPNRACSGRKSPRRALALALLALVGAVGARCPMGMRPVLEEELDGAWSLGAASFGSSAFDQWCDELPVFTNEAGLEYYNVTIEPTCKSEDGVYHFTLESENPCDDKKMYVGYMDVATNASDCNLSWVDYSEAEPVVNATRERISEPLECPDGYRLADAEEAASQGAQLLWQIMVDPTFKNWTEGQIPEAWYCDDSPGFRKLNITDVSACMSDVEGEPLSIIAQGKVVWVCTQQARRRTISLTVATEYTVACVPEVDLQMGDEPEVYGRSGLTWDELA